MNSNEEALTGFAGFGETISVSFRQNRLGAAVVVSVLLHLVVFVVISAYAGFNGQANTARVNPPVITASLVFEPRQTGAASRGNGSAGTSAAKKKAIPIKEAKPHKKAMQNPPRTSFGVSSAEEPIAVKPPAAVAASADTLAIKPPETSPGKWDVISVNTIDLPAAGTMDLNGGTGVSNAKTGGGLQGGLGGQLSYAHASGVGSGEGEGSGAGEYGGGGLFSENSAAIPRYRDNTPPVYPPSARRRGYQGLVVLIVEVMADGRPGEVRIGRSSGHEILDHAAQKTAMRWRFEPGRKNGKAVRMLAEVPVRFVLDE